MLSVYLLCNLSWFYLHSCRTLLSSVGTSGRENDGRGEVSWRINERCEVKMRDEKNSVPPESLSGLRKEGEGGEERVRFGQPFCWSPKQINQGPLEHINWITQLRQGGGTHGKAATKQQQGWVDHSFRHFLKLIIHAGPSLLFFYLLICPSVFPCSSVCSTFPPTPLILSLSFEYYIFHKWIPLISSFYLDFLCVNLSFSHIWHHNNLN